ncbi:MAG: hypothetical protein LBH33_05500 [Endomicrobium sp.]|jgi:hypothetical protein|nr:hypothetical protein [Endomicrobium sp.]
MIRSGVGDKRWVYDKIGEGKDNKEGARQIGVWGQIERSGMKYREDKVGI